MLPAKPFLPSLRNTQGRAVGVEGLLPLSSLGLLSHGLAHAPNQTAAALPGPGAPRLRTVDGTEPCLVPSEGMFRDNSLLSEQFYGHFLHFVPRMRFINWCFWRCCTTRPAWDSEFKTTAMSSMPRLPWALGPRLSCGTWVGLILKFSASPLPEEPIAPCHHSSLVLGPRTGE